MNEKVWERAAMTEQQALRRLAAAIKADRRRKFKTVEAARAAAGVSRGAWDGAERGEKMPRTHILDAIADALGWPPGKVDELLGDVTPSGYVAEVMDSNLSESAKAYILERIATDHDRTPPTEPREGVTGA